MATIMIAQNPEPAISDATESSGSSSPRTEEPEGPDPASPIKAYEPVQVPAPPPGPIIPPRVGLPPAAFRGDSPDLDDDGDGVGPTRRVRWRKLEDAKIVEAVQKLGRQWPEIAAMLPGRTAYAVESRWHQLKRERAEAAGVARSSSGSVDGPPAAARSSSDSIDGDKLFEILASTPGVPDLAPLLQAYKTGQIEKSELYKQLKAQVSGDALRDALKKMQHA